MYLSFTAMIFSLFLENSPYIDVQLWNTLYQPHYSIGEDYFELDYDMDFECYFEADTGAGLIYDFQKIGDTISRGYRLELYENYNMYEISHLIIDTYITSVELLLTYDDLTINIEYSYSATLFNRTESVGAYYGNSTFTSFKEVSNDTPFLYRQDLYWTTSQRVDFRGFSYEEGYQIGYQDGYNDGEQEGFNNGYNDGYQDGEYMGSMTQPIFKLFNAVFRSIDIVLQTEVLPGIKLWYIVSIPLVFLIIQFFINLWR